MLFVDYSSAFNTIVPATLVAKLQTLGLNRSLCSWILDFLTGRSQVVRMGNNTSSPLILNTGAPQGCVLSPLLYSLYTHDCTATHSSNVIVKFADDTTVIGLITDNDETAYREEVSTLTKWCQETTLTQHRQDQGAGGGLQETEQRTHTHHHRQDTCGVEVCMGSKLKPEPGPYPRSSDPTRPDPSGTVKFREKDCISRLHAKNSVYFKSDISF